MDRHAQNEVNYALSSYKLDLFYEMKEIEKKYNSVEVGRAFYEVIRIMVDDVIEKKEKERKNE